MKQSERSLDTKLFLITINQVELIPSRSCRRLGPHQFDVISIKHITFSLFIEPASFPFILFNSFNHKITEFYISRWDFYHPTFFLLRLFDSFQCIHSFSLSSFCYCESIIHALIGVQNYYMIFISCSLLHIETEANGQARANGTRIKREQNGHFCKNVIISSI